VKHPQSNAVIIFMMDVSGSMGEEQKELVRLEASGSIRGQKELRRDRKPVHRARCVGQGKWTSTPFYHLREDGGHQDQQRLQVRQATSGFPLFAG